MLSWDGQSKVASLLMPSIRISRYQIHLAQVAVFDDSNLTFNVHAESRDYAFSQAEVTNPVVKHLNDENAFHGLSIVGGLDISMFSDGKKAVAQLVVLSFPQLEVRRVCEAV